MMLQKIVKDYDDCGSGSYSILHVSNDNENGVWKLEVEFDECERDKNDREVFVTFAHVDCTRQSNKINYEKRNKVVLISAVS